MVERNPLSLSVQKMDPVAGDSRSLVRGSRIAGVSLLLATLLSACAAWYLFAFNPLPPSWLHSGSAKYDERVALVVAAITADDTTWVGAFSDWTRHIYVADDPNSNPLIPLNKGREATVYLTYVLPADGFHLRVADGTKQTYHRQLGRPRLCDHLLARNALPVAQRRSDV